MSDRNDDRPKKGRNPQANRRWFLRRLSALGGGAVAGLGAASKQAEAQAPRGARTGARPRTGRAVRPQGKAATPLQFKGAFQSIKAAGTAGPTANRAWAPALQELSASDRIAAVAAVELSQRNPGCKDIAGKAAALLQIMNVDAMRPAGRGGRGVVGPGAVTTTTEFAGGACGGDCSDTTGAICGGGCAGSTGFGCGGSCLHIADTQYSIDKAGNLLSNRDFANMQMADVRAAMTNAAQAYDEVFGAGVGPATGGRAVR